jgi:hypothetical protein
MWWSGSYRSRIQAYFENASFRIVVQAITIRPVESLAYVLNQLIVPAGARFLSTQ